MRPLRLAFVAYLAAVLVVTLWPSPQTTDAPRWTAAILAAAHTLGIPLTVEVLEPLANVVMFVPFGLLGWFLAADRRPGTPRGRLAAVVVLAGCALSASIETVQLAVPGRVTSLQDVVVNTAGALVGVLLALLLTPLVDRLVDRHGTRRPTRLGR
ncbi:VanZ family protein [Oerskovia flava]|uniref:VanZ family protein n=1 Tax=Oerskovia flava TaxID=2986422 RepID=UPI002240BFAB|nr:VanZ family protein [Oerskovia sp. JB1-3-2]